MSSPTSNRRDLAAEARQSLGRILANPLFVRSPRQSSFLQFVVEKTLAGEEEQIKEYQIAVSVYGRRTDHSTRIDPIVRVEAARLRNRLKRYYLSDGSADQVRIELPKGSYVPEFRMFAPAMEPLHENPAEPAIGEVEPRRAPRFSRKLRWWCAIAAMVAATLATWSIGGRAAGSPLIAPDSKIPDSIAVLPFVNQAPDRTLSEGVTEAIITELSQSNLPHYSIRSVIVNGDPALRRQRADAVLSGTVSVNEGIVRVTGSLQHSASRIVLWNGSVERKLAGWQPSERGAMLEDLASAVVRGVGNALGERGEQETAAAYPPRSAARRAWLEGDELQRQGDPDSVRKSIALLEKAETLDPNFGWNHASLAFAYVRAVELGFAPEASYRRRAHEEAARAMELSPYLATSYSAAVRVAIGLDWNVQAAAATCMTALNLLSSAGSVRFECARVYALQGRHDDAAALQTRSLRRADAKAFPWSELAWIHYRSQRFEQARDAAEQALSLDANLLDARCALALSLMTAGHANRAIERMRAGGDDRSGRVGALLATALALQGDRVNAAAELARAEQRLIRPDRSDLIRPYLALGWTDRAKAAISEAAAQKNGNLLDLIADPQIAALDRTALIEAVHAGPQR